MLSRKNKSRNTGGVSRMGMIRLIVEWYKIIHWITHYSSTEIEKLQDKFTKEFENLANKILDEKSKKFTVQNKENLTQFENR